MTPDTKGLSELAMWSQWQDVVRDAGLLFCKDRVYVEQASALPQFEEVAGYVAAHYPVDLKGRIRDAAFGGVVAETCMVGPVTRMWLDANIEIDFLRRHLPVFRPVVLDIGAGYGRLAVVMAPLTASYCCTDAVPISEKLCRLYTAQFRPEVQVLSLEFWNNDVSNVKFDLAINIHSWNECSLDQIARWLALLREMKVPWLFTVSHALGLEYLSYDLKSWKEPLMKEYDLAAEECIGLGKCPHALWRRR